MAGWRKGVLRGDIRVIDLANFRGIIRPGKPGENRADGGAFTLKSAKELVRTRITRLYFRKRR